MAGWRASGVLLRQGRPWSGSERNCAFLNCGRQRKRNSPAFANISAVTGLDFLDDGRGIAMVDWDHDGDLDLWLSNRTGPRLRLMLNQRYDRERPHGSEFVAFKLRGTSWTCNTDAIGARVEVVLNGEIEGAEVRGQGPEIEAVSGEPSLNQESTVNNRKLIQTLHAGDGFVSQSSKWLHFGLGRDSEVERVIVHWPGGEMESFSHVQAGAQYSLVEGTGRATRWIPPRPVDAVQLDSSEQTPHIATDTPHVLLPSRIPLPILRYTRFDDRSPHVVEAKTGPLLINLWASWCLPCMAELKAFTELEEDLRATGLDILALSVDGLDDDKNTQPEDAKRFLDQIGFPFGAGVATPESLDKMDIINEFVFDRTARFTIPVSFLVDQDGWIVAVYRGPVSVDVLLRHLDALDSNPDERRQLAVPFPGSWYGRSGDVDLAGLASMFREFFVEDTERYLNLSLEQLAASRLDDPHSKGRQLRLDDERVKAHRQLVVLMREQGRWEEAIMHARQAVDIQPQSRDAQYDLAVALQLHNQIGEAIYHYREVLRIAPQWTDAHRNLGGALASVGQFNTSLYHFREAVRLRPGIPEPLAAMALILATHPHASSRRPDEAIRLAEQASELTQDQSAPVLDTLAAAYAAAGRFDEAVQTAERALVLLSSQPIEGLADRIRQRLELYKQKRPYVQRAPRGP